jgi:hypothetical protein
MPPVPYLLAETILNKHGFEKTVVPLTSAPEMTWYIKGSFAVGIKKVFLWSKIDECCYFEFLYGKFLYVDSNILGMKITKKITRTESLETITPVFSFIENLPEDLALCIDIEWAKPLIEAYFKDASN